MTTLGETTMAAQDDEYTPDSETSMGDWNSVFSGSTPTDPGMGEIPSYEAPPTPPRTNWTGNPYGDTVVPSNTSYGGLQADPKDQTQFQTTSQALRQTPGFGGGGGGGAGGEYGWAGNFAQQKKAATGAVRGSIKKTPLVGAGSTGMAARISRTVLPKGITPPTFAGPTWSESAAKARGRKLAAPATAALNQKVQQAMSRYYENPNVRRMVLRDTLQGYGIGLANIVAQSERAGRQDYAQDYSRQYSEAMTTYAREWQNMMLDSSRVTTAVPINTKAGLEDVMTGKSKYTAKA